MVCKAETHKKLEACIGVVNDCLDMLQEIMYLVIL